MCGRPIGCRIGPMDAPGAQVEHCPECGQPAVEALVVCAHCGEVLPLRVVLVSEGSHGGGFALVTGTPLPDEDEEADI
jgi:hypothetical protein